MPVNVSGTTASDGLDADAHLRETRLSSQALFKGNFLHAFRDDVTLPDGSVAQRDYLVHPGAVMIVPLLTDTMEDMRVVLERPFRHHCIFH